MIYPNNRIESLIYEGTRYKQTKLYCQREKFNNETDNIYNLKYKDVPVRFNSTINKYKKEIFGIKLRTSKTDLPVISIWSAWLIDSEQYIATNPKEEKLLKQANILIHLVSEQQYSNGTETIRTPFPMQGMILNKSILIELRTGGYSPPSGKCTLHRESAERVVALVVSWSLIELRIQYSSPSGKCT